MIDWAQVNELRVEMGEAFDELVEAFLQETDEGIGRLDPADGLPDQAASLHFLKGAALNLGFHTFARLCSQGEEAANRGQSPAFDPVALHECYAQSRTEFLAGLARRAA
jgi:HPt (histidine-containing phosphotransfer) domain-containing protein